MKRVVAFGSKTISYELRHSGRGTFALTVQADRRVIAKAPVGLTPADADMRVRRRGAWIMRQLRRSSPGDGTVSKRRYVSGSSHYLFGRELHLRVQKARSANVTLERPLLRVQAPSVTEGAIERELGRWRVAIARDRFVGRLSTLAPRVLGRDAKCPPVRIVVMRRRWGSCSRRGMISLNPWLSEQPTGCIDYVLLHELCHLKHLDHGPRFRRLLGRLRPDWKRWKRRLDGIARQA